MTRTALALICLGGFLNCGTNTAGGDRRISNGPSAADSDAGAAAADDAGPVEGQAGDQVDAGSTDQGANGAPLVTFFDPMRRKLAVEVSHGCVITQTGGVKCWTSDTGWWQIALEDPWSEVPGYHNGLAIDVAINRQALHSAPAAFRAALCFRMEPSIAGGCNTKPVKTLDSRFLRRW